MENEKLFELIEKMYLEMQNGFSKVNGRLDVVESSVRELGAKIDGEITENLRMLSDEQSMTRKEVSEINQGRLADRYIIQDIKLAVDALHSNQRKQENKIVELDRKLAK
jgi:hypothetical protein